MLWTQWLTGKKEIGFVILVVLFRAGIIKPCDLGVLPFALGTERTLDCQIEVYACLSILNFLPPWTHLIRACTISILGSNATLHANWAYCGIKRVDLAVDVL